MKSTVARIAINLCRMMSVVALLRSCDALLPTGKANGTLAYDGFTRLLAGCPGLSPSPCVPRENVRDGVIPHFLLRISEDDFQAILSLAEPLYLHACHILSLLPAVETVKQPVRPQSTFFNRLPDQFTRQEAVEEAQRCGITLNTLDSMLKRMTDKGVLVKTHRGEYEFASRIRACACREAASSASLQVSGESEHPE